MKSWQVGFIICAVLWGFLYIGAVATNNHNSVIAAQQEQEERLEVAHQTCEKEGMSLLRTYEKDGKMYAKCVIRNIDTVDRVLDKK